MNVVYVEAGGILIYGKLNTSFTNNYYGNHNGGFDISTTHSLLELDMAHDSRTIDQKEAFLLLVLKHYSFG